MVFRVAGGGGTNGTGYYGYYGSFYSTQDQSDGTNTPNALTLNNTAEAAGVSIANNGSGNPTRITFANAGVYNIQFSAQLHYTGGGGSGSTVNIWFRLNGTNIPNSDTKITVNSNNPYQVAAWNFVSSVSNGDYIEIIYSTDNSNIVFEYDGASGISPAIPSLIVTAQQIR